MNWSIGALPGENFDTWTESIRQKSARLCDAGQPCSPASHSLHPVCPAPVGPKGTGRPSKQPCSPSGGGFWAAALSAKPKVRLQNAPGSPSGCANVVDLPAQGSSSDRPGATHCPHLFFCVPCSPAGKCPARLSGAKRGPQRWEALDNWVPRKGGWGRGRETGSTLLLTMLAAHPPSSFQSQHAPYRLLGVGTLQYFTRHQVVVK